MPKSSLTPPSFFPLRRTLRSALVFAILLPAASPLNHAQAQVRLNELMAAPNARLMSTDEMGRSRPGSGRFWADPGFSAPGWQTGAAPLGFGGASGLGTNVSTLMLNRTPNLYIRRVLNLTAPEVANEGALQLRLRFDDGFIAYINGREVARSNAGPAGHYIFAEQKAYNFAADTTNGAYTPAAQIGTVPAALTGVVYSLGKVSDFLRAGENVLAVQLINREPNVSALIDAQLEVVTASIVVDLARFNFNEANDSTKVHRNLAGTISNTLEGTPPANSWLALSPNAQSAPGWTDLTLRSSLPAGAGYDGTGALRYTYSQTDAVNKSASVAGPPMSLASQIAPGSLTEANLADLRLAFRFRATSNTAFAVRLDPDGNSPASSLTALATLNSTAGSGTTQEAPDDFSDSAGGKKTRTVNTLGVASSNNTGTVKNSLELLTGPAMRDGIFSVLEDNTAGSGTGAGPGALRFEVVKSPVVPDFFGFRYQSVIVRSWTATAVTPAQLKTGAMSFDYQIPTGVSYSVYLESASGSPTTADRLSLGNITGTGSWRTATLDTGSAGNQTAFISYLNSVSTNAVRVVFISNSNTLPTGSRLLVDNVGYVPWRTYNVTLSTGTNAAAFVAAVNAQPSPQMTLVLEKTGTAAAPSSATVTIDDLAVTLTKTSAGTPTTMVPYMASGWSYYPGLAEPSGGLVEPADFTPVTGSGSFADWIELLNAGASPVDISNWALTDEAAVPRKFVIPPGTTIAAGGTLIVVADNRPAPAGASFLHAPFSLSAGGEYLGLTNASGAVVDSLSPGYPEQTSFYSWGRDPATSQWGYLRTATPGETNTGAWQAGIAATPVFGVAGGFYAATVTLPITTPTAGAIIRYTADGSEPSAANGLTYTGPLSLPTISDRIGHVIRARSIAPGLLPSPVVTNTYLVGQNPNLLTAPAVLLSGDSGATFYKPNGILSIQSGTYNGGVWAAVGPSDYNVPVGDGRLTDPDSGSRPYERPSFMEYYFPDNRTGLRENIGVRVSSSPYSRPRLVLSDPPEKTLWAANATLKPSFNIFFRSDYGNNSISYPLIPETEVRRFEEFRMRAGKNDIANPFIRDEFIRRLFTDMGHEGTVGTFTTLYINGYFKGYFNLVERIREAFMQNHHRSSEQWDVNYIGVFEDGDNVHWNTVLQPRLDADLSIKANWDSLKQILDINNVIDYYLLNTYSATWDWPQNNWAMARERSSTGIWRCYVWDAEGGFGLSVSKPVNYQTLLTDLLTPGAGANSTPIPVMFRRLMTSPEFRLLFADRIQKHLFNDGVLTDAKTAPRRSACQAEVAPLMNFAGLTPDATWYTSWINPTNGRRATLFPSTAAPGQFRDPNQDGNLADTLWPLTLPPAFNQHGGTISPDFTLTISHTAPAESTVYFTTDGTDPRAYGGTVTPGSKIYTAPVALGSSSTVVRSRVQNATTLEWSPLTEARFALATVPASAANTVVSEVMYNPPPVTTAEAAAGFTDAQDFEYIVLRNIGSSPIDLSALRFNLGITFGFDVTNRPVIDPGQRFLLAKNASALRARYGSGIDNVIGGEYFGSLNNAGEIVRLEVTANGTPIKNFTYDDAPPWPLTPDGQGPSLMLVNPNANPDHDLAASWTASAGPGGSPTGVPLSISYTQWATWTFTALERADAVLTGPTGDFDRDGLPNLIEALAGTDPRAASNPSPVQWSIQPGVGETRVLRLTFPALNAITGYTLMAESSTNLTTWQSDFSLTASTPQANGAALQQWEKTVPAATPAGYLRLRATPTP